MARLNCTLVSLVAGLWLAGCAAAGLDIAEGRSCPQLKAEQVNDALDFRDKSALHALFLDDYGEQGVAVRLARQADRHRQPVPQGSSGKVIAWGAEQVCRKQHSAEDCTRVAEDYAAYEDRAVARRLARARLNCAADVALRAELIKPGSR